MDYIVTRQPDEAKPEPITSLDDALRTFGGLAFPPDFGGETLGFSLANRPLLVDLDGDRRPPFGLELDCAAKIAAFFAETPSWANDPKHYRIEEGY